MPDGSNPVPRNRFPMVAWAAAALCVVLMTWVGAASDEKGEAYHFKGRGPDYYSLLVRGFLKGHLYMDVAANPGLASSDPDVRAHTDTLLDANYYKGRFYLYYGVVPAALLLLPYHLVTGQDLGANAACLAFWILGFGASVAWLRRWWGDQEGAKGGFLASVLVIALAFLPATTFLVRRSMFYEFPLVAGYAFISIFFAAVYEAVQGRKTLRMLALASASAGLAVGCHPNHILLLPIVAWVGITCARGRNRERARSWGAVAAACLVPAAVIGAGLAWYNYARFGDILEFGFHYGQNGFFAQKESVFVPGFLWANLKWYFLTPPAITPYFPFVFPGNNTFRPPGYFGAEAMFGQFPATLAILWVAAGVAMLGSRPSPNARRFGAILGYAAVVAFLFVGSLQIRANRYMVDFATPLAWLVVMAGGWTWMNRRPGFLPGLWRTGFATLVALASVFFVCSSLEQFDLFRFTRQQSQAELSGQLNVPYSWLYRMGNPEPGLLTLKVHFAEQKDAVVEPLVTTGTPGFSDSVFVAQYPNHYVKFSFDHFGYGGSETPLIQVDPAKQHVVEISMGSFYPPVTDAYMGRFTQHGRRFLKRLAYLKFDGVVVINDTMVFYDAPPWSRQIGENTTTLTVGKKFFSGTIDEVVSGSAKPLLEVVERGSGSGVMRIMATFPKPEAHIGIPLLGVGVEGDGNLIFARSEDGKTFNIAMDDWGYGVEPGSGLKVTPGDHVLDFVLGPIVVQRLNHEKGRLGGDISALRRRYVVFVDGKIAGDFPVVHHMDELDVLSLGSNPQGFSTARSEFGAGYSVVPIRDSDANDLIGRAQGH